VRDCNKKREANCKLRRLLTKLINHTKKLRFDRTYIPWLNTERDGNGFLNVEKREEKREWHCVGIL
jgi:hypothetical protein